MVALIWVNPVEHSFACATVHPGTLLNLCRLLLSHDDKEVHTADGHRNSHTTYFWRVESLYIYVLYKGRCNHVSKLITSDLPVQCIQDGHTAHGWHIGRLCSHLARGRIGCT